jgi:hypothetical protein
MDAGWLSHMITEKEIIGTPLFYVFTAKDNQIMR